MERGLSEEIVPKTMSKVISRNKFTKNTKKNIMNKQIILEFKGFRVEITTGK
jgi:hypothetical protein